MSRTLDVTPSPHMLEVLGEIPLEPWQCIAELIDNSLDEFSINTFEDSFEPTVEVSIESSSENSEDTILLVTDNGKGMTESQLELSLKAGYTGKERYGTLGLFGMGFNVATARLGDVTKVTTSRKGESDWLIATIDFRELRKTGSFKIPLLVIPKQDKNLCGTKVEVRLKKNVSRDLNRSSYTDNISTTIGDIYSYMLRDGVPGLKNNIELDINLTEKLNCKILLFGKIVIPKLPCIWSAERTVHSRGKRVDAVQIINKKLSDAIICLLCGNWHAYSNTLDRCERCGEKYLKVKERRVFGWLGIQRYLDTNEFGIDFLRHGRKILRKDKTVFTWRDPDTFLEDIEYPIEMPANRGRIVGEVHLDHVPVTYQKNDFDRQSKDWTDAIEVIRGRDTLKPKRRTRSEPNNSPLAILYSAFRRNDPGLKCLVPGDGKKATHSVAVTWARRFDEGIEEYLTDKKWYNSAAKHDRISAGLSDEDDISSTSDNLQTDDECPVDHLVGVGNLVDDSQREDNPERPLTIKDIAERYKIRGSLLDELSGEINLKECGTWNIEIWSTKEIVYDESRNMVPATVISQRGNALQIFVYEEHELIGQYGKSIADIAFMEVGHVIKKMANRPDISASNLFYELIHHFPDEQLSESTLKDKISVLTRKLSEKVEDVIADEATKYWEILPEELKKDCEQEAASVCDGTNYNWGIAIQNGSFIKYGSLKVMQNLLENFPEDFLDGNVFKPAWDSWHSEKAQQRILQRLSRPLDYLNYFKQDTKAKSVTDLKLASIFLEEIEKLAKFNR